MDTIANIESCDEFIELHRTFNELSKHGGENDDLNINRLLGIVGGLDWPSLIKEYRLIILSEAGSGKTYEIRNIAHKIRTKGKPAFFLRLEHISTDFEDAFEVGSYEAFENWLASGEEGWLLLDSIDEARIRNPSDFELAIRKLSRRIDAAKDRAHIVITGRTTAWRPKTDLAYCIYHLPYAGATISERDQQFEDAGPEGFVQTDTKTQDRDKSVFKIVTFDDLTSDQIAVFVKARGLEDSKAFLDAVERADAWSFTTRPQDLEELIQFWIDNGRIGTRLELVQNNIDRRLVERDQNRDDASPLPLIRARQGSTLLAAAATLTKDSKIRVPDGADSSTGIAIQTVLPDWDGKDQSILLSRPIFDESFYSAVRFHHRSVREYLTAEWFAELLKRETSRRSIETLFFRNQYGLDIVVPTLRPTLPWLGILDAKIRERLRKVAPEILFEGGDPSQLPLEVRRYILREVCEQIAEGATDRLVHEYAAVQRFANLDLTDDVRALIRKYANNEDLKAFLLRMVWIGQLAGALPEAMDVALTPITEHYARISAFRAIKAIGSDEDQETVRQSFLAETSVLDREWLAELIGSVQPTEKTLVWLLACLEKSKLKEPYTVDHLTEKVTEFVDTADIDLLPQIVTGLNNLLSLPPMVARRYCEVSERFQWLMTPASKAIERLISTRHPASLDPDALSILNKFSAARDYEIDGMADIKAEFSELVLAWKKLNRALFWFEVQRSREVFGKKRGERVSDFWQVSLFTSLWTFEKEDFEYVAEEIRRQALLDNKLVALSLAFNLYKAADRPREWRVKLKKLAAGNNELAERLRNYLSPPAQSQDERRFKQQEARWKRQNQIRRKNKEKYHADWKKYLNDSLDDIRAELRDKPGIITNSLYYLSEQARSRRESRSKWAEYNWKTLIPEYGEDVARFYRDGTVSFWRHHEPTLRSEGAPLNKTPYAIIIGLTGLEIEAHEIKGWPKKLSATEVELACKYASFELNGFPTWFPKLFETHPKAVSDFLMQEVRYELSIEKAEAETYYILSDVSWSGQWAWDQIAPAIYDILKREPKNPFSLDNLLKILQGSTMSDDFIEKLASRKCRSLKKTEHAARWFALWAGIAPKPAIKSLEARIQHIADPEKQTLFAMIFVTHLLGTRTHGGNVARGAFKTPEHLKSLCLLLHEHIRVEEDINRTGTHAYSPGLRDDAQDARGILFNLLNQILGKAAFMALMDIAEAHPRKESRSWILSHAKTKAEQDGDIDPWLPSQVRDFHDRLDRTPRNHRELAELGTLRLLDLKDDLEHGDSAIAATLQKVTHETEMRKFIGRELREKAFGRYSIPQEEELADGKKPDLKFHGVGFDGPVPVELKLADKKHWTGPKLFERLENQLCGDYLRDRHSSRGIFVIVYRGKKPRGWQIPGSENLVDFAGLTVALQKHWLRISPKFSNIDDITVIGIDLTKRSS